MKVAVSVLLLLGTLGVAGVGVTYAVRRLSGGAAEPAPGAPTPAPAAGTGTAPVPTPPVVLRPAVQPWPGIVAGEPAPFYAGTDPAPIVRDPGQAWLDVVRSPERAAAEVAYSQSIDPALRERLLAAAAAASRLMAPGLVPVEVLPPPSYDYTGSAPSPALTPVAVLPAPGYAYAGGSPGFDERNPYGTITA